MSLCGSVPSWASPHWAQHFPSCSSTTLQCAHAGLGPQPPLAPLNFLPLELLLLQLCPLCDDSRITTSRPLSLRLCSQIAFKINKKRVATRVAGMQVGTLSLAQLHDEATPRNQVSSLNTRLLMEGAEVMQALGLAVSAGAFTGGQ